MTLPSFQAAAAMVTPSVSHWRLALDLRLERRIAPRRNTMIVASIVFDGGRSHFDCVIRDMSDGGAKLQIPTIRGVPDRFDLMVPGHRPQPCRVVWRALKELGVQFVYEAAA